MTITSKNLPQALAAGGALTAAYDNVWHVLWEQPYIPAGTLELCRLRLAQLHGATADTALRMATGVSEEKVRAVLAGSYIDQQAFSAAELAILELAEIYVQDPAAITDEVAAQVKQHVGEAGLVCLVEALGFFDGRIRLSQMFNALRTTSALQARGG